MLFLVHKNSAEACILITSNTQFKVYVNSKDDFCIKTKTFSIMVIRGPIFEKSYYILKFFLSLS